MKRAKTFRSIQVVPRKIKFENKSIPSAQKSNENSFQEENHVEFPLTKEQRDLISHCLTGKNVFITGGAGTGKSTVLSHLIARLQSQYGRGRVFITATTGLAAVNIGGTTVHHFAGLSSTESPSIQETIRKVRWSI